MHRIFAGIFFAAVLAINGGAGALAQAGDRAVSIATLIAEANSLNRMTVVVRGEVIGDILPRKDFSWVNIQDDTGQMSVWAPNSLLQGIIFKGDYNSIGDTIEVEGEFMREDPALQGEMRVKAESVTLIKRGEPIKHPVPTAKKEAALILGILAVFVFGVQQRIRRRK